MNDFREGDRLNREQEKELYDLLFSSISKATSIEELARVKAESLKFSEESNKRMLIDTEIVRKFEDLVREEARGVKVPPEESKTNLFDELVSLIEGATTIKDFAIIKARSISLREASKQRSKIDSLMVQKFKQILRGEARESS